MDFKPLKKDRKAGPDGLFGWESPRLREALRAAKEAGKQMVAKGVTPTNYRTTKDVDMIARDLGAACVPAEDPTAERGCEQPWLPPQQPGYSPWIEWTGKGEKPQGQGHILFSHERRQQVFYPQAVPLSTWSYLNEDRQQKVDTSDPYIVVAYCLKDPS